MKRILTALFALLWAIPALAQVPMTGAGIGAPSSGGGACAAATTFLARTSGLSANYQTAYTNYICGLVTDGVWAKCDALYIWKTNTSTTAALNLTSTSFSITTSGTPTFAADSGWAGNGTNALLNTNFNFSTNGTNYTRNSDAIFAYNLSTGQDNGWMWGGNFNGTATLFFPYSFGSAAQYWINSTAGPTQGSQTTSGGLWTVSRTTSTNVSLYRNSTLNSSTTTDTSAALENSTLTFLGGNTNVFVSYSLQGAGICGGLTATDVTNLSSRISTYIGAVP